MAEYTFTVAVAGQVCMIAGGGNYVVERAVNGTFQPLKVNGAFVRLSPTTQCAALPYYGEYRIQYSTSDCPFAVAAPEFNYVENPTSDEPPPPSRTTLGEDSTPLTAGTVSTLSAPAGSNHAELHVWTQPPGGGIIWTVSGDDPSEAGMIGHRTADGGVIELESATDIANFKATPMNGATASVYASFYEIITHLE